MTSELTCYGYAPCADCAACRERDAEIERSRRMYESLDADYRALRAQLDAAREAWRHEAFTAFHPVSGKSGVVYAVTPETVEAVAAALGGDA